MNSRSNFQLSFDPDAWELSVVHRPREWLPASSRLGCVVNPRWWQTRSARGFSWHRAGCAVRRKTV
jgi:hypothetical protein